jgi:molecular chaperone DnaJ
MMSKDYYRILEIDRNATEEQIKKSYRKLSKKYHPDLNPNDPESENKFKEIAEAYSVLSDKDKKNNYDNFGDANGNPNPFGGMNMDDVFSSFFGGQFNNGGRRNVRVKGNDIRVNLPLSLEEIYDGVEKKIKYKRNCKCDSCSGTGGKSDKCTTCGGNGFVNQVQSTPFGKIQSTIHCPTCNGVGEKIIDPCKVCNGNGVNLQDEFFEFNIFKGVMDGESLRVNGKGNAIKNGVEGDLIIFIIEKPHEKFRRTGLDLYQRVNFTFKELSIGSPVEIDTIDGKIRMNIKEGTQVGSLLRVPKKGLMRDNQQGDMIIEVWLDIPKNLTEENKLKIVSLEI